MKNYQLECNENISESSVDYSIGSHSFQITAHCSNEFPHKLNIGVRRFRKNGINEMPFDY